MPGAVEPMLPEVLSNRACSLRPGEEKLAVTVELEMEGAEVRKVAFHRSRVRSDARLTYGQVDAVFAGRERAAGALGRAARGGARGRPRPARATRLARDRRRPSRSSSSTREGHVVGVRNEEQTESHSLIEALMVLANEQVAGYLEDRKLPTLYRVHERPEPRSVEFLADQLASLDIPTPPLPRNMTPQQAADAAAEMSRIVAREAPDRRAIGVLVLRALKQAYYTPRNLGHAGLASPRYTHFTSPIRRYPDVVAHRALLQGLGIDHTATPASELDELGVHTSALEREAMQIERKSDDVCLAFLLERRLAEAGPGEQPTFEGEVVGLIEKGAFVRFGDAGFEGFMGVRRMREWWTLNEFGTALVTESAGRALRLGDPIEVTVERVEAPRGRVDLAPIVGA